MSQDSEKFLYFQVALLKDSFALDALRQDALKYHMIDHPGQLIALRLTEYYEIMSRGMVHTPASVALAASSPVVAPVIERERAVVSEQIAAEPLLDEQQQDDSALAASQDAEQNAEEAAEYWSLL